MRTRFLIVALCCCACSVWAYYGTGDAVYGDVAASAYAGGSAAASAQYGAYYNNGVNTAGTVARGSCVRLSEIGAARPDLMGDKYTPFAGSSNRPGATIHTRSVTDGGGMNKDPNKDPHSPIGDAVPCLVAAALLYGLIIRRRNLKNQKNYINHETQYP